MRRWFSRPSHGRNAPTQNATEDMEHFKDHTDGLVPYDENLLERARTQWQFGDWASLIKLERETLQHHPDRAKLALLAAAGHMQQGEMSVARQFTRLAQDWGCSKKLVSQILIAGVHNSLGRAAAINGEGQRALQHFESAIAAGAPASEIRLLTQARLGKQLAQLGLSSGTAELKFNSNEIALTATKKLPSVTNVLEDFNELLKKQGSELDVKLTKQSNALAEMRKFISSSLKQEVQCSTKQIEAFFSVQNYFNTGELPVEMHGWPISPDFACYLIEQLENNDYDLIIEFGSGSSTILIAKVLAKIDSRRQGGKKVGQIAFEHLEQYYAKTMNSLHQANLVNTLQLVLTPLQPYFSSNGNVYSYYSYQDALAKLASLYSSIGLRLLVLVDGPPGTTCKHARYPALPVVLEYFTGAQIDLLLDDYIREDEKEIAQLWQKEINDAGLSFTVTEQKLEKGACLIRVTKPIRIRTES